MNRSELIAKAKETVRGLDVSGLEHVGLLPKDGKFFPAILYPPKTLYPSMTEEEFLADIRERPAHPLVAYAHIPFCPYRCEFCHFYTQLGATKKRKDRYLSALLQELDLYLERLKLKLLPAEALSLGGGTPTCLTPAQLERFLDGFTRRMEPGLWKQFTCDVDPTTIIGNEGRERLRVLRNFGVDRVTIGAQSFDDRLLGRMNRKHSGREVVRAVEAARGAGFESVAIDLIFGYPGQTLDSWIKSMEAAVSIDVDALQLYRLRIEPHGYMPGAIQKRHSRSAKGFPSLDSILTMKAVGRLIAEGNGYSDRRSTRLFTRKHEYASLYFEEICCKLSDYIGLGVSSFSSLHGRLGMNGAASVEDYCERVERGEIPIRRGMTLNRNDELRRLLVAPLKNIGIVFRKAYRDAAGANLHEIFGERIALLCAYGLLTEDQNKIELTDKGRFFADEVCIQFYEAPFLPFPKEAYTEGELSPHAQRQKRPRE